MNNSTGSQTGSRGVVGSTAVKAVDADSRAKHHRERLRQIIAPVAAAAAICVVILLIMVVTITPHGINTVATLMSVIVLTPLVLLCFVPYLLLLLSVFGVSTVYSRTSSLLTGARNLVHGINGGVRRGARIIALPVIRLNQAFAWTESLVTKKSSSKALVARVKTDEK